MQPPQGLAQFQDEPLEEEQVKEWILPLGLLRDRTSQRQTVSQ